MRISWPVSGSQRRTVWSRPDRGEPEPADFPAPAAGQRCTSPMWPDISWTARPSAEFQIRIVPSAPAVASVRPSGPTNVTAWMNP